MLQGTVLIHQHFFDARCCLGAFRVGVCMYLQYTLVLQLQIFVPMLTINLITMLNAFELFARMQLVGPSMLALLILAPQCLEL